MGWIEGIEFLTHGFRKRTSVGAIWPSSKALSRAMVAPVFADRAGPIRVLEVGAGMGPFTSELVARMEPWDHLDVVELNADFCARLQQRFGSHAQVRIHQVSILEYTTEQPYDHIVSGLPLANFPADVVEAIYHQYFDLLRPGGTFIMFEHLLGREALSTFGAPSARRRIRRVMEYERALEPLEVGTHNVLLNVPPARVRVRRRPLQLTG